MNPFHQALQSWKGPGTILTALKDAGYDAHGVYRNCVLEFCRSRCLATDLEIYWEETAKEYVSSAGSDFDFGKSRNIDGYYKSPYLEKLRLEAQNLTSKFSTLPSVHPCIHEYESEKSFGDRSLYPRIRKKVEERKAEEVNAHKISSARWTGRTQGLQILLGEIAGLRGFEIIGARENHSKSSDILYGRRIPSGLLFYFRVDHGVWQPLTSRLPIEFWIGYEKATRSDFFVADFRYIVDGFEQYGYFGTPEGAVLGAHALVYAFDALARSF